MGVVVLHPETHPSSAGLRWARGCKGHSTAGLLTCPPPPAPGRGWRKWDQESRRCSRAAQGSGVGLVDFSSLEDAEKCYGMFQWLFKHGLGCEGGSGHVFTNGLVKPPSHKIGCLAFQVGSRFLANIPVPAGMSCGVAAVATQLLWKWQSKD